MNPNRQADTVTLNSVTYDSITVPETAPRGSCAGCALKLDSKLCMSHLTPYCTEHYRDEKRNIWFVKRGDRCPKCSDTDVAYVHRDGDSLAPETYFYQCLNCNHRWGME